MNDTSFFHKYVTPFQSLFNAFLSDIQLKIVQFRHSVWIQKDLRTFLFTRAMMHSPITDDYVRYCKRVCDEDEGILWGKTFFGWRILRFPRERMYYSPSKLKASLLGVFLERDDERVASDSDEEEGLGEYRLYISA